jgi:hypothetical protein
MGFETPGPSRAERMPLMGREKQIPNKPQIRCGVNTPKKMKEKEHRGNHSASLVPGPWSLFSFSVFLAATYRLTASASSTSAFDNAESKQEEHGTPPKPHNRWISLPKQHCPHLLLTTQRLRTLQIQQCGPKTHRFFVRTSTRACTLQNQQRVTPKAFHG